MYGTDYLRPSLTLTCLLQQPFRLTKRHNEIWIQKVEGAASQATSMA